MDEIRVKSILLPPDPADGFRVFVDRQLPGGVTLDAAVVHLWLGEIAPSLRLQKWYRNDRSRWEPFLERYHTEIDGNSDSVTRLFNEAQGRPITLLFAANDVRCNTAVALKRYLDGI